MISSSELCEEFDPFEGAPSELNDLDAWLRSQGWEYWFPIGNSNYGNKIQAWYRARKDQDSPLKEWMIEVHDGCDATFYLRVRDLPAVLDLLSRWGHLPLVERAAEMLADFTSFDASEHSGILEHIAGRAAWAAEHLTERLDREVRDRRNQRALDQMRRAEKKRSEQLAAQ